MEALERLKPLALLLLRCALGIIFMYHGYPKLFSQTASSVQFFTHAGFPAYFVYVAGIVEFFGGALLIAGLATRVAALLIAGEMVVAIWKVNLGHGIYAVKDYEFPMALAAAAFTLATVGAGAISLDQPIFHRRGGGKSKRRV